MGNEAQMQHTDERRRMRCERSARARQRTVCDSSGRRSETDTHPCKKDTQHTARRARGYRIPESLSAFCNIVSFTAANTSRILLVSVACVKLSPPHHISMHVTRKPARREGTHWGYTLSRARFACMNRQRMYFAALLMSAPPVYSGKYRSRGTCAGGRGQHGVSQRSIHQAEDGCGAWPAATRRPSGSGSGIRNRQ